jgi:outer membrane protein OmpA-like peptidoglycan-associated protein
VTNEFEKNQGVIFMALRIQSLLVVATRISTAGLLVGLLAACSSPKPPRELESAQMAYDTAAAEGDIEKYASVPLYEAKKELDRANETWSSTEDADETAHLAGLAEKRVEIARTIAEGGKARAEVETLLASRQEIELEAREKEIVELKELQAKPTDSGMILTLGGDVLFKTGGATVSPGAQAQLGRVAQFLKANADREVVISGHTDSTGGAEMNQTLSEKRAAAVGAYLSGQGIAASRIATRGFGASLPIAPNDSAAGRQQNRRVDIVILNAGEKAAEHVLAKP